MSEKHASLVCQATRGESVAIESLLRRHLPGLRVFIRMRSSKEVRDKESSSDLVQSVCREVLEHLDGFEYRGEAAFRAWLFAKGLSKVQDRARYYAANKRDAHREAFGDRPKNPGMLEDDSISVYYADLVTPSRVAISHEEVERIEQAFEELPESYREVITLVRVVGLSQQEVADRLHRSLGSIRGLLDRALTRLSWILSRNAPHDG